MLFVSGTVPMRVVAAKGVVSRGLLFGEQRRRPEMD